MKAANDDMFNHYVYPKKKYPVMSKEEADYKMLMIDMSRKNLFCPKRAEYTLYRLNKDK